MLTVHGCHHAVHVVQWVNVKLKKASLVTGFFISVFMQMIFENYLRALLAGRGGWISRFAVQTSAKSCSLIL